jgi:predicted transposase/invertase (TIGR01784 family)
MFSKNIDILIDLVNSVLEFPELEKVKCIEIKNPQILAEDIHKKYIILDIMAYDDYGRQYNIEMQAAKYDSYPDRAAFYLSRIFGAQLEKGEPYHLIAPVFGIHFLDYIQYPAYDDFHFNFSLRDIKYNDLVLSNNFSLHLFELPKITSENNKHNKKNEWLYFLKNAHKEKEENMQTSYTNPVIHKAFQTLKRLSEDEETRMLAEAREMAIFNKRIELGYARKAGLEEGMEKGMEKGMKKGMEKGMLKGAHKMIIEVLNENFGNVPECVKTRVSSIDNQSTLKALLFESFKSKDLKSFEKHL